MSTTKEQKKLDLLKKIRDEKASITDRIQKQESEHIVLEKKRLNYEKENKLLYFNHPDKGYLGKHGKWDYNPIQKRFFKALRNPEYTIFTLTGSNRISKTFSTTGVTALTALRGHFPWEDPSVVGHWFWEMHNWEPPIKVRIVGQDWEKHIKGTVIPCIQELWPKSWNIKTKKNNIGVDAYYTDPYTGGSVEIMSNKSESDLFEGWHGHLIIYDEPPKREVRVACSRGLIDFEGLEFFAMTLLKEAWIEEDIMNMELPDGTPDPCVFSATGHIDENVGYGITEKGRDNFAKGLNSDEYAARIDGVSAFRSGLVLGVDKNIHYISRFDIPSHWIVDVAIDIGVAKPHDILYFATAPNGFKYVCFEQTLKGDGTMIADSIIKRKNRFNLRINRIICDPLAKGDQNNENSTWDKIDIALNRHDMYLEAGSKDKEDGIIEINNLLKTVNNMPALFIFRDLPKATKQLYGWRYDDKGVISKKNDDMCENLYRLILLGTEYEEQYVIEDYEESSQHTVSGKRTGYG
jgi:hypothetical protein